MEPISALLFLVGAYGVSAVVRTLSGSSDLGALSAELFKALRESESHIDARLSKIEGLLDKLLEQRYSVALSVGVQRFLDASEAVQTSDRSSDLKHARGAFIEATAAAQSCLQKAVAERYLLLTALAQGRSDLAPAYLTAMESTTTAAAFEAMALTEWNSSSYELMLQGKVKESDPGGRPQDEVRAAALESLELCGRLLAEGSALAPELGLPPRVAPPTAIDLSGPQPEWVRDRLPLRAVARVYAQFERPHRDDPVDQFRFIGEPYWTFEIRPDQVLRLGSLAVEVLPTEGFEGEAGSANLVARLTLDAPVQNPIVMHWVYGSYSPGRHPMFLGWQRPFAGIEVPANMLKAELPVRPLGQQWGIRRHLDPSTIALSVNPVYSSRPFVIVTIDPSYRDHRHGRSGGASMVPALPVPATPSRLVWSLTGHTLPVICVAFCPDGRLIATGSWDTTARLWDPLTGQHVRTLYGRSASRPGPRSLLRTFRMDKISYDMRHESVTAVAFSPDGRRFVTASASAVLVLWDVGTWQILHKLKGHTGPILGVAFSPDGGLLATASSDSTARLWDPGTGRALGTLEGHTSGVSGVAFSPDGRLLATASADSTARLWDPVTGQPIRVLSLGHQNSEEWPTDKARSPWSGTGGREKVLAVEFSSDGAVLATASSDSTVGLWDPVTGRPLGTLEGHTAGVSGLAFSPDGRLLATASFDGTVRLWDVGTRRSLGTLEGHTSGVSGVAFSPDGRLLATASIDRTAGVWN
jgi:WD40 repeat protein